MTNPLHPEAHTLILYTSPHGEFSEILWNGCAAEAPTRLYSRCGTIPLDKDRVLGHRPGYVPTPGERVVAPVTMTLVYAQTFADGMTTEQAERLHDTFVERQHWMIASGESYRRAWKLGEGWDEIDNDRTLVMHHGDADGFCSAWAAWQHLSNATFRTVEYGDDVVPETGVYDHVFMLDFCPDSRADLDAICAGAKTVTVIDHHKTSVGLADSLPANLRFVHSLGKAACRLTAEHFSHREEPSWLVNYVEDRDLWRFNLPDSREINAALTACDRTFAAWDAFAERSEARVAAEGHAVLAAQHQAETDAIEATAQTVSWNFGGKTYRVLAVNCPLFRSEIGETAGRGFSFSVVYYSTPSGRYKISLRSSASGRAVDDIAVAFGGGGHKYAAGFECDELPWTRAF